MSSLRIGIQECNSALSLESEGNHSLSVRDPTNLVAGFITSWSRGRVSLHPRYSVVWGAGDTSFQSQQFRLLGSIHGVHAAALALSGRVALNCSGWGQCTGNVVIKDIPLFSSLASQVGTVTYFCFSKKVILLQDEWLYRVCILCLLHGASHEKSELTHTMLVVFLEQRYSESWPEFGPFTRPFFRKEGLPSLPLGFPAAIGTKAHLGAPLGRLVALPAFKAVVPYSRFSGSLVAINSMQYLIKKADGKHASQRPAVHVCIATDSLNF